MNEEFEFLNEQPLFFETEEEAEVSRRRIPSRRFVPSRRPSVPARTAFRKPGVRPGTRRFPPRVRPRLVVRPAVWPGLLTAPWPITTTPYPPGPPDQPPPRDTRPFGASGSGSRPPVDDEPAFGTLDPDMPQDPSASMSPPAVEGSPAGVEGTAPDGSSDSADDASEFALEFQPGTFVPTPIENPGGGRIKNKQPPDRSDVVTVRGVGRGQVPLHRLAATALEAMISAARAEGLAEPLLRPTSGFRDPARQAQLWKQALAKYGSPQKARKWVAPPGGSAHQTGRAIDLYLGGRNDSKFVTQLRALPAYQWLVSNAQKFGFYPYAAEPWHWEYNPPVAGSREWELNEAFELFESENYDWRGEAEASPAPSCAETGRRATALVAQGRELNRRTFARRGGALSNRIHAAMDVPGPRGALVYAPLDGQVIFSGRKSGYGNIVILLHSQPPSTNAAGPGAVTTAYGHLEQRLVNAGACVAAGQAIGKMGNSAEDARGNRGGVPANMGVHLHFSVNRVQGDASRPRYRDRAGVPDSQAFPDRAPQQLGRLFSSRYEEDWTRMVRPDRWLAELGIRLTASSSATRQSPAVQRGAQAR